MNFSKSLRIWRCHDLEDYNYWLDSRTNWGLFFLFSSIMNQSTKNLIMFWWWIRNGFEYMRVIIHVLCDTFSLASIFCISASSRSNKLASLKLLLGGIDPYQATNVWLPKNSFFSHLVAVLLFLPIYWSHYTFTEPFI